MKKTLVLSAVAAFGLAGPAFAKEGMSYSYAELDYLNVKIDGDDLFGSGDIDGDGVGLLASLAFGHRLHGYLEYQTQDFDFDIGIDTWELGLGLAWPLSGNVDFIGRAAYAKGEGDVAGTDVFDENGYSLQAGIRALAGQNFELEGLAHHVDLGDDLDGTTFRFTGRYNFTDMFSGTLGVELDSDTTMWMAGFRLNFGNK